MTTTPSPEALAELSPEMREAALAGLKAWSELPDDKRNGERPWIMGFNAGWEACDEQRPTPTDSGEVIQGDGPLWSDVLALVKAADAAAGWITKTLALAKEAGTLSSLPVGKNVAAGQRGRKEVRALRDAIRTIAKASRDHRLAFSRPEPVGDEALVERVARAMHRHQCARLLPGSRSVGAFIDEREFWMEFASAGLRAIQAIPAPATGEREQIVALARRDAQSYMPDSNTRAALDAFAFKVERGDHRTQSGEMEGGEHG